MMDELLKEYAEKFGDGFPMIPLAWGKSDLQVMDIIRSCIEAGKDAYEMGLVEDDEDVMY